MTAKDRLQLLATMPGRPPGIILEATCESRAAAIDQGVLMAIREMIRCQTRDFEPIVDAHSLTFVRRSDHVKLCSVHFEGSTYRVVSHARLP